MTQDVLNMLDIAWKWAEEGSYDVSAAWYEKANNTAQAQLGYNPTDPILSLQRHSGEFKGSGIVSQMPQSEDWVLSLKAGPYTDPDNNLNGKFSAKVYPSLANNLKSYQYYPQEHHLKNIKGDFEHTMVLSTGRCGTVSLFRLFQQLDYLPYHAYLFMPFLSLRLKMMCQHISGNYSDTEPADTWVKMRAAEWIGAENAGKRMIGLNHLDTVFAPTFAKVHPKSRFIYIHRDPVKIFQSFYSKNQWGDDQIIPIFYQMDPFKWADSGDDLITKIAWYIRFTEKFSRSFGSTMGDRFIEISSDKLFKKNAGEIKALEDFTKTNIPKDHFDTRFNQKLHKKTISNEVLEEATDQFIDVYEAIN